MVLGILTFIYGLVIYVDTFPSNDILTDEIFTNVDIELGIRIFTVNVLIFSELKLKTGLVINVEIPAPHRVTQFVVEILV